MKRILLLALIFLSFSPSAEKFTAKVTGVTDGDTIYVLADGKQTTIRLAGIDCPEKAQAYGQVAKKFTSDQVFGKNVIIEITDTDQYGRSIANVYLEDSTWLNFSLVESGMAWHYKQYSKDKRLAQAEESARSGKIGLWKDLETAAPPIAPWEFRRNAKSR